MTNDRPALSSERTRQDDSYCKGQTCDLTSGHESQTGLDTKTDWLTDRQSQCDFDFDLPGLLIALMMEAARTSETLVNFYQTTRCYNQKTAIFIHHRIGSQEQ
jgi:hypothetical protein